jgi:HK97 family phage major capsid protein
MDKLFLIETDDDNVTKSVKEKLNTVYEKSAELTGKVGEELKEAFKAEVKSFIEQNTELKAQIKEIVEQKAAIDAKLAEQQEAILEINRFKSTAQANAQKGRTFGDALMDSIEENAEQLQEFAAKKTRSVRMEMKAVGDMGLSSISGLTAANVEMRPGVVPYPNRLVHMRDIIPTGRMSTSLYNFLKEIGFDGSIATWQENSGAKPQFDIRYQEVSAPSQFIAGYLKISRKALDDIPALKSTLSNRLLQKYLDAEDQQVLSGTGANGQLLGLYAAGNSITYVPGRTKSVEMIVDSMSIIEELNHNATDVIMRPRGYNDIMLSQSAGSTSGIYSLPGQGFVVNNNGQINIAGADLHKTTAMVDNSFMSGDFKNAAMILLREDPIVEFFEQDGDNVKNNQITVRVEGRIALPVFYNDALIHGSFVNPGS